MARNPLHDILAFLAVAREQSFTRAAGKLGVSQSALSHTIRTLEARMGVRLLIRTTRSVSPTEAGERLLQAVGPELEAIEAEIAAVSDLQGKPGGSLRITATDYAADQVLRPRLAPLLRRYPDIHIEIHVDYALTDIVAQRYDLGVRWGDQVAKDMVAVRVGPDVRSVIVGAPAYFAHRNPPASPQDLVHHNCIGLRLASGEMHAWELNDGQRELRVQVQGQAVFNGVYQILAAALDGCGLAFLPEDLVQQHVEAGRLCAVLCHWAPVIPGLHVYYSQLRPGSRALELVIDALRYRPTDGRPA
ncbi:LysR family transcriptional regulator [Acidovorax sp. 69]|uniref:LysR family transcriptional regulator n=1 Tax=Acidovorax sp. 69 TaxID=2035202 RepID=UPI000C239781|nr:LysR family transcriptional regulator [Acidovorax sp. 69]PJI97636.1 LysR family transcriptional regulator [Acidovorax sp. 69]